MRFVVEDHHLPMWIFIGIPAFDMTFFVGYFVSLLWILMIARSEAKLIAVFAVQTLRCIRQ